MTRPRTVRPRTVRSTSYEARARLNVHWETDRYYWQGFRAGMVVALVLVILAALGYLVGAR